MKDNQKYVLITNDVESTSILNNQLSDTTANQVLAEGLPSLLELYSKYNVQATFFFTGYIAKLLPETVKIVNNAGHEVGSHGLTHDINQSFDLLTLKQQIYHLKESKKIIEDIIGEEIISFRAPAARVNKNTAIALKETGFKIDSSISSQRFDMFMTFGNIKKLKWLISPRIPYYTKYDNIFERGEGKIFEIPISALFMAYIGTTIRIFPNFSKLLRSILSAETKLTGKPIVFLTHPNEFIDEEPIRTNINRRVSNPLSYLMGDILRRKLKLKNLGKDAIPIYENHLNFYHKNDFRFLSLKNYLIKFENQD